MFKSKKIKFIFALFFSLLGLFYSKNNKLFVKEKITSQISKKEINLVYVLDDKYTLLTCVSATSVMENKNPDTFIKFHFLVPEEFKEENIEKFLKIGKNRENECNLNFHKISSKFDYTKSISNKTWSKVVYYKLLIPDYIKCDKCIYVDGDTLIMKDLKELYDQDVSEYFIGGVRDQIYSYKIDCDNKIKTYINSGMILWNLKKCRKENIKKRFIDFIDEKTRKKETIPSVDQDVINIICGEKIKNLHIKFNTQTYFNIDKHYDSINENFKKCFKKQIWQEVSCKKRSIIGHFCGNILQRPWEKQNSGCSFFYKSWWKNAKKSPVFEEIKSVYKDAYKRANLSINM